MRQTLSEAAVGQLGWLPCMGCQQVTHQCSQSSAGTRQGDHASQQEPARCREQGSKGGRMHRGGACGYGRQLRKATQFLRFAKARPILGRQEGQSQGGQGLAACAARLLLAQPQCVLPQALPDVDDLPEGPGMRGVHAAGAGRPLAEAGKGCQHNKKPG